MRSDKQNETSRTNGRKSTGPKTEQGKANSAQNAATHNLATRHFILLSNEDPEDFEIHESGFLQRFQPIDSVEYDLVQKMIIASWRERRIGIMESSLFELEMERQRRSVEAEFTQIGPGPRQVLALFGTTDASAASSLLLRYGSAARRQFASAFRILRDLQGDRFNRGPAAGSSAPSATSAKPEACQQQHQQQPPSHDTPRAAVATEAVATSRLTLVSRRAVPNETDRQNSKLPNEPERHDSLGYPLSYEGENSLRVLTKGSARAAA